ncbi:MAG: hypothetical protein HKP01_08650 [Gemmatimonadetes bacterium]|nr:hypothetical protein [Gemmatimonadota bacterium]
MNRAARPERERSRVMVGAALVAVITVSAAIALAGPEPGPEQEALAWTAIHPDDWGLEDIAGLRSGRISLRDGPDGPTLVVYRLRAAEVPDFPPRVQSRTPTLTEGSYVVADFDGGIRNRLDGFFNSFEQAPSRAAAALATAPDGRVGLHLSYTREERGFCGLWVHFFDATRPPHERIFLDARSLATLSFWVRGAEGGERVVLKLADERWERLGDAVSLGEVGDFLPSGRVETEWQQAVVPLGSLPEGIADSSLASLVLEGIAPARGDIYVSRLAVSRSPDALPPVPDPTKRAAVVDVSPRATWIWNTRELLDDPAKRDGLLGFFAENGFDTVFLQLVSAPGGSLPAGEIDPDPGLRDLLTRLHASGVRVYALDGFKRYALPEYHPAILATIRNVARYNAESAESERFYGVRYDIEPYLLPGFHGPRQGEILGGYLDILARGANLAREGGLRFGADIPFWYDAPDEKTFEPVTTSFRGVEKPVSEHVIDLVDDIAIMDYRTAAYGADGVIRHAEGELRYADLVGKQAYVALETGILPDEILVDFEGEGGALPVDDRAGSGHVGLAALGDSALVIWRPAPDPAPSSGQTLEPVLTGLGVEPRAVVWWPATRRIAVPGGKLSFAGLGLESLQQALIETTRELGGHDSFAGFAIHYSESYRKLVEPERR